MVKDGEKLISFRFDIDCDTDSKILFDREMFFETTFRICSQNDEKNYRVEKCSSIFYNNNFLIVSESEVFIETTFRICSQKDEKKNDHVKKGFSIFYNVKPFGIKQLWDPDLGWYKAEEDTLILEFRLVVRVSTAEEMAQKALSYGTHFLPLIRSSR
ncbi:hypothetical protein niasHS_006076 [Heterodera schachtii]|uniref:MATH domain-containing protein n=1 Tax=Heterodera schachtii TaxID=97005 RepID=A0ABD2JVX7_HETSC